MSNYTDAAVKGIALNPVVKTDTRKTATAECKSRGIKLARRNTTKKKG